MKAGRRIGYFGGTFDPPHLGHLIIALEAYHQLNLDRLDWILTPDPPHKTNRQITPVAFRLEMLQIIINKRPEFFLNMIDIDRDPPHYAAETVELIKDDFPDDEVIYLIGEDSLKDLPGWYASERFITAVDFLAIAPRPGISTNLMEIDSVLPGLAGKTVFLRNAQIEIASSIIRDRIIKAEPFEHFLPNDISKYLKSNPLYK